MKTIQIKEPYAGQVFVLSEDCALDEPWVFDCEHEFIITRDSFSHDAYPGAVEHTISAECEYGCDLTEWEIQDAIDNYYDGLDYDRSDDYRDE